MSEYYVRDLAILADKSKIWNASKEAESRQQGHRLRDYFTQLAKSEGVDNKVMIGAPMIGLAPPLLQVFTDAATAQKLEKASNGRLAISGITLH